MIQIRAETVTSKEIKGLSCPFGAFILCSNLAKIEKVEKKEKDKKKEKVNEKKEAKKEKSLFNIVIEIYHIY